MSPLLVTTARLPIDTLRAQSPPEHRLHVTVVSNLKRRVQPRLGRFTQKECQVKSSQVQISMAAAPAAFGAPAGAIDREGAARRNWHGWKAPSRGFIVYPHRLHVFFLIIAGAPQVTIFVPFSGSFPPLKGQLS